MLSHRFHRERQLLLDQRDYAKGESGGHGLCSAGSPLFFFSCLQEDCEIDPIREKVTETHEEDTITQCHNSPLPVKLLGTM